MNIAEASPHPLAIVLESPACYQITFPVDVSNTNPDLSGGPYVVRMVLIACGLEWGCE